MPGIARRPPARGAPRLLRRCVGRGLPLVLAAGVIAALAASLHAQQQRALRAAPLAAQFDPDGRLRPLADICDAVRAAELVTVRLRGTVSMTLRDERWRGTTEVTLAAPVTYLYGVDLSRLAPHDVRLDPFGRSYRVEVPQPRRLAVEVDLASATEQVRVSGTRFRSLSGETLLSLARRDLWTEARRTALSAEQSRRVLEESRRSVEALVAAASGGAARVAVSFRTDDVP